MQKSNIKRITVISVLCAISYLCTFLLHFDVMFLTFDLKDAIIALSALIYGPLAGFISSVVVALIEFVTISDTGIYGLLMNFLSSATFACTLGFIYKYRRTFSGAILGAVMSVISVTAVMLLANLFITPYYMGVARSDVVGLIPTLLLPFNIIKSVVNAALTMLIYKPVTKAFSKMHLMESKQNSSGAVKRTVILATVCMLIIAAAVLIFIFVLKGSVSV